MIKSSKNRNFGFAPTPARPAKFLVRGFTLIELLVVLGVLSILAGMAFVSLKQSKINAELNDAQSTVLSALEQARSQAASGVVTGKKSLHIENNTATIFEGDIYPGSGDPMPLPAAITISSTIEDIIFERLTAKSNWASDISISLSNAAGSKNIKVEPQGAIIIQ